jgi:hypothetical protein
VTSVPCRSEHYEWCRHDCDFHIHGILFWSWFVELLCKQLGKGKEECNYYVTSTDIYISQNSLPLYAYILGHAGSGLEKPRLWTWGSVTLILCPQKFALTSPRICGRSLCTVLSRTQARLSAVLTGSALLPRNIIIFMFLVLISVRD